MTRARDLADIISGGFTESDIPDLSASKITSGSFADGRIPNLAASKITSGAFDAGRLTNAPSGGGHSKTSVGSTGSVSLDLSGDDNYYDAGTLTGNTTLSFTNAPTTKRFIYTFIPSYDSSESSVNDTDTWVADQTLNTSNAQLSGMHFYNNGLGFLGCWYTSDTIIQLDLNAPYDLSSAQPFDMNTQVLRLDALNGLSNGVNAASLNISSPRGLVVNGDGTRINLIDSGTDKYYSLSFSTGYDLSTYTGAESSSVSSYETSPTHVVASPDGMKIVFSGSSGDDLNEIATSAFRANVFAFQRSFGHSSQFTISGLGTLLWGKNGKRLFGWQQTSPAVVVSINTASYPYSLQSASYATSDYKQTSTFGGDANFPRAATWIANDVIMLLSYEAFSHGNLIECGTGYRPTLPSSVTGDIGHFSRSYRHFLEFETTNGGTNYQLINHSKVYVG